MSRRWRYPRSRRGAFWKTIQSQAPVVPPYVPVFQEPAGRNSRPRITRRGRFYSLVSAVVAQVASYIPAIGEPAGRNSKLRPVRRGQFYSVPPAVTVTASTWPPTYRTAHRTPARTTRRGEFLIVPLSLQPPVQYGRTRRPPSVLARHGRFYGVPPVGVLPGQAPWPPSFQRPTTRRLVAPRRGEFIVVPLVGVAPAPPSSLPQILRARVRALFARRGRYWAPPLQQQPAPLAAIPARVTSRRPAVSSRRRNRTWHPPWLFVPPAGPGPYIPRMVTAPHRPPMRPTRRGVFIEPAWPSTAHSCTTPRPNIGTTPRVSAGITSRPNTGSSSPVSAGVTTRPDAGITAKPCGGA